MHESQHILRKANHFSRVSITNVSRETFRKLLLFVNHPLLLRYIHFIIYYGLKF